MAERWDQLLREGPVCAKPVACLELREVAGELVAVAAEDDVVAPATEAWLEHDRRIERGPKAPGADHLGAGVRQACPLECARREELDMCRHERTRRIEHGDAVRCEAGEGPEPLLDPVQRLADVETAKGEVAGPKHRERLPRREQADLVESLQAPSREARVRPSCAVRDNREAHRRARIVRRFPVPVGVTLVNGW